MSNDRANLGFGDALDDFDPSQWTPPQEKVNTDKPKAEDTKKAAKAAGFKSREVRPVKEQTGQGAVRRRRTGRDTQFNVKTKAETKEAFIKIADAKDWGLGETLEKAVELLEKEYG